MKKESKEQTKEREARNLEKAVIHHKKALKVGKFSENTYFLLTFLEILCFLSIEKSHSKEKRQGNKG